MTKEEIECQKILTLMVKSYIIECHKCFAIYGNCVDIPDNPKFCMKKFISENKDDKTKPNKPTFKPAKIKLKVLVGPAWSKDPIENKLINDMVNGR